jgi:hypothetical protein
MHAACIERLQRELQCPKASRVLGARTASLDTAYGATGQGRRRLAIEED